MTVLDFSFFLTIVGALLSVAGGVLGLLVKLETPVLPSKAFQIGQTVTTAPTVVLQTDSVSMGQTAYLPPYSGQTVTTTSATVVLQGNTVPLEQTAYPPQFNQSNPQQFKEAMQDRGTRVGHF